MFDRRRRDIGAAVKLVHSWGATVLDVETGRDSRSSGVQMLNDALDPPKPSPEFMAEIARQVGRTAAPAQPGVDRGPRYERALEMISEPEDGEVITFTELLAY